MFNNGLSNVKGIMFDCYKTLIDIKTNESSIETYKPLSNWLMYHGVKIYPADLMNEYKWRCKEEIERCWERHAELKVEDIFAKIVRQNASWPVSVSSRSEKEAVNGLQQIDKHDAE